MLKKKYKLLGLFIVFVVIIIVIVSNPLLCSEPIIRRKLLKETPIGINMDNVIETLKSNENYEIMFISYENGFGMSKSEPIDAADSHGQEEIEKNQ